jgi:16S rRNA processing protein RimM
MVVMGRVVAPYGVFGWIKVIPDTEQIDGLFDYDVWWVGKAELSKVENWREMKVEAAKIHNDVLVVKLFGVNDRDAAFSLKGQQVAVPRAMLPEPKDNEYYWSDLIGLNVKNTSNIELGVIVEVFETGANDVIVVRPSVIDAGSNSENQILENGLKSRKLPKVEDKLLPFITSVILEVNIKDKNVLVDWDADF